MVQYASYTDVGIKKMTNQDSHCIELLGSPQETVMAVVCDGVGGLSSGEYASNAVVDAFTHWFETELPTLAQSSGENLLLMLESTRSAWAALLQEMNAEIKGYGAEHDEQLGTTFTGLLACGGCYLIGQVGDCRAYRISKDQITQLTEDQTWVARELARGAITEEEARTHPKRSMILQSVGTQSSLNPVFYQGSYEPGDMFVLCCDGFYHTNTPEKILEGFSAAHGKGEDALREACTSMTREAMMLGEKDNITVLTVDMGDFEVQRCQALLRSDEDDTTCTLNLDDCPTASLKF